MSFVNNKDSYIEHMCRKEFTDLNAQNKNETIKYL